MKILVTGNAGFVGRNLLEKLHKTHQIIGLDIKEPKERLVGVKYVRVDITNENAILKVMKREKPYCIIHLAALAGVIESTRKATKYVKTNVYGTANILQAAKICGIKNLILASTSSVSSANKKADENNACNTPPSIYAATKKANEIISYVYCRLHDMNITNLRFYNVYGKYCRDDLALTIFTKKLLANEIIELRGRGKLKRDYTHVDDIIQAITKIMYPRFLKGYNVLNVGTNNPKTNRELLTYIENAVGRKAKIVYTPMQKEELKMTHADIKKAKRLIGYTPKVKMQQAINDYVKWYKEEYE